MTDNQKTSWLWPAQEDLQINTASDMRIMTLFESAVEYLIVRLKKAILLYNLQSLEENVVRIEGTIAGVLHFKETLFIIDSQGFFYEIMPDREFQIKKISSNDSEGETLYVKLFSGGYLRIEKENIECFISIHWVKKNKKARIKIPIPEIKTLNDTSCVITLCKWCEVSPELALRLLTNKLTAECQEGEIAFITVGNGALYYLHVPQRCSSYVDTLKVQFLFQCDLQPIIGIFCLKDSASETYSRIALLQPSGVVQSISYEGGATELSQMTTYVPCDVHCYAELRHRTLVCSDTKSLWSSVIPLDSNEVVSKHKKFAVKGVRLVAAFGGEETIVILTNRGNFHRLTLSNLAEVPVDCAALEAEIERSEARFSELQRRLEVKRESVWVRSIVTRAPALQGMLVIIAKVSEERTQAQDVAQIDNAPQPCNENGDYVLDIKLVNNSGIIFTAKLWSLQMTLSKQGNDLKEIRSIDLISDFGSQMLKIEQKIQMGSLTHLRIDCRLISRLEDDNSLGFMMIKTSSLDMDSSYFFRPTEEEGVYDFSIDGKPDVPSMLLKLEEEKSGCKIVETKTQLRRVVYHLKEHNYMVMLPSGLEHRQVWLKLLENSLCPSPSTFVDEMKLKDSVNGMLRLRVLVGMRLVRFKLDDACSKLTIKSHDLLTLHCVKDAALKLLATLGSTRLTKEALRMIKMDKEEDVVSFQDRHRHLSELENLRCWRRDVTMFIPV